MIHPFYSAREYIYINFASEAFCDTVNPEKFSPYAFREGSREEGDVSALVGRKRGKETAEDDALLCSSCANRVTGSDQAVSVGDSHFHTFFNPAGIVFELGCFRTAPGCLRAGDLTAEFTWFQGCLWCFSLCRRCGAHLGWYYQQKEAGFFGLILARLRG